ncbi:cytosolic protein [archaeon]|nr:cytosolic protein [archaeon]TET28027.1 MAG: cytosolic protein [Candidatus Bathyarchaeum sp.]
MTERSACPSLEVNSKNCRCSYVSCGKRGKCCECIRYHLARKELPACAFPPDIEKTYDRSIERFVAFHSGQA